MVYDLVEYEKKYEEEVIKLWQEVCVEEFEFEIWKEAMSNVEEEMYEKVLLAIVDDKVIATMAYKDIGDNVAEIKRVYMYPEYRGKGISQAMLDEVLLDSIKKGYRKLFIETWAKFARGIGFYEKNDFILKETDGECFRYERELSAG